MIQTLLQDVRYAIGLLRRSPAFAATAVLTLALSIGANTAIFSAVQGVLVAPLPYPDPERLVRLFEEAPTTPHFPMAPADFRDYRAELQTFEGLAAYQRADLQLGDLQQPEQLRGMQVTSGFFKLLGAQPAIGREFEVTDEIEGNNDVVIFSHSLWMRRFNGDPDVVGRVVRLSGRMFRVVGVLPEGFQHVGGTYRTYGHGEPVDVWSVLAVPRDEHPRFRFSHYFNVVGRVRRDVGRAAMEEDLRRTGVSVAKRYPTPNSPWKPTAVPLKDEIVGTAESTLLVLSGAASAVLLLACVNVAGLLLGRASGRSREIGVRAALGATRWRLARQLLIESLVLATVGGTIGVGLAYIAIAALARFGPSDMPRLQMIEVNAQVLFYAVAATLFSALLFGLAPALRLVRAGVGGALKEGGRTVAGSPHQRLRRVLAAAEVALAFVLVVSSGLLLRSFVVDDSARIRDFSPRAHSLRRSSSLRHVTTRMAAADFYRRAAERVRALPGVREAAFSSDLPWTGYDENTSFSIVGRQFPDREGPEARYHFITHGYTRATGTPLVAGRELDAVRRTGRTARRAGERSRGDEVLEDAGSRCGRASEPLGRRADRCGRRSATFGTCRGTIARRRRLYFPQPQTWYPQPMFLIARSDVEPASIVDPIRRALREIDPELPLANVRPLDAVAGAAIATRRLTLWLVATFGLTALLLAVVGIYGVMAQAVGQRTREFGVRQALGATRGDIMRLVFSSGATMTIAGLLVGVALAAGSMRLLVSLLYGVSPLDPVTFAGVAAVLAAAASGAAYLPARRAARISAATALRAGD